MLLSVLDSGTIFYFNNIIRSEITAVFMYKGSDHKFWNREKPCWNFVQYLGIRAGIEY